MSAALAAVGVMCLMMWVNQSSPATSASSQPDLTLPTHESVDPSPSGTPTRLRIPAIDVSTSLLRLGLNTDKTVEVPAKANLAGWYRLGARPGDTGSAVILGHVDSPAGPAVFARLAELQPGQRLQVDRRGAGTSEFVVTSVETYPNADFPAQRVYARTGGSFLNLVTCGGTYDAARGGYQANVVVYTRLMTSPRT